jgi:hypothetical protein
VDCGADIGGSSEGRGDRKLLKTSGEDRAVHEFVILGFA